MLTFTEEAKTKVQEFIQGSGKKDMALRITVTGQNANGFTYHFELEEYENERPDDVYVREGGFVTRIDPESAKWLKGATVQWTVNNNQTGFTVNNPNKPLPSDTPEGLQGVIIETLKSIYDPEIPVNIYDLGLIYKVDVSKEKKVKITMTLTAPNCPAAEYIPSEVKNKVQGIPGVIDTEIDLTWDPPWDKDMMSEAARLQLGI